MEALECRVHSVTAASAAACQSLGISLPVSKPATQIADPCRNVCSLGKAGCTPLKCLLARGMHSTARAARMERGETCQLSSRFVTGTSSTKRREPGMEPSELPAPVCARYLPRSRWVIQPPEALGRARSQNRSWRGKIGRRERREGNPGEDARCWAGTLLPRLGDTQGSAGRSTRLRCSMSCFGCSSTAMVTLPAGNETAPGPWTTLQQLGVGVQVGSHAPSHPPWLCGWWGSLGAHLSSKALRGQLRG